MFEIRRLYNLYVVAVYHRLAKPYVSGATLSHPLFYRKKPAVPKLNIMLGVQPSHWINGAYSRCSVNVLLLIGFLMKD